MIAPLLLLLGAAGAAPAYTVSADWHLVEGIASDGKRVWVSSIVDRAIVEVGAGRAIRLPATLGAPFGIAWDAKRKWLWVAAMCPTEPVIANCGKAGLAAIDDEGRVRKSLTLDGINPGDLSVDAAGNRVFLSDSLNGAIYACKGDCTALRPVINPAERASAQGSAVTPDGRGLVVADYSRGIILIDLAAGTDKMVKTVDGKRLRGMDGLLRIGTTYVGIQNAASPAALVAFRINEEDLLDGIREIETPAPLTEGTQLTVSGERLLLIGDAQWRLYAGKEPAGAGAQQPTPIVAVPLSAVAD